jgi:hypothetical protein
MYDQERKIKSSKGSVPKVVGNQGFLRENYTREAYTTNGPLLTNQSTNGSIKTC